MIEKEYKLSTSNEKAIEKVIFDENLHYLHMCFQRHPRHHRPQARERQALRQ